MVGFSGCVGDDTDPVVDDTYAEYVDSGDLDQDGVTEEDGDCDDSDPSVRPGRTDLCNGIDDNCNETIDEGNPDADGDSICDGQDVEECDALDNDGDGAIDEGFPDEDQDGEADCAGEERCDGLDNDGDDLIDEGFDEDGDGATLCGGDCADDDADVGPDVTENNSNSQDDDCDGVVDEGLWEVGDLVITEVMINPQGASDPAGEWFEVVNQSGRTLILDGLTIESGEERFQVGPGALAPVGSGDYVVFGINPVLSENGSVALDGVYEGVRFENVADELRLIYGELLVDGVEWTDATSYVGVSMELSPNELAPDSNDVEENWCPGLEQWAANADHGTPGEANETCSTQDGDGDGFPPSLGDCDDEDNAVYPGAPEIEAWVDNDCDGDAELGPTAVAALDGGSVSEECGVLMLDASGSSDPDGDTTLRYAWTLIDAPADSEAVLANADAVMATFVPEVDGDYSFSLSVWDSGEAMSLPDVLEVSVDARTANAVPVADAGDNQSDDGNASCVSSECRCEGQPFLLDGSNSTDADGDPLSYRWEILSGDGLLSSSTGEEIQVDLPGLAVPNTSGATTQQATFVALVVTDCLGLSSVQDVVALTTTCTR